MFVLMGVLSSSVLAFEISRKAVSILSFTYCVSSGAELSRSRGVKRRDHIYLHNPDLSCSRGRHFGALVAEQ
jgi:hypothetical protein